MTEIQLFDRKTKKIIKEDICCGGILKFLYRKTKISKIFLNFFTKSAFFSKFFAFLNNLSITKYKINSFVKRYKINTLELEKKVDIVGSIVAIDNGKFFNRLIWVKPEGGIFTYDKRHLFRMAGEDKVYSAGNKNITVDLLGWRILDPMERIRELVQEIRAEVDLLIILSHIGYKQDQRMALEIQGIDIIIGAHTHLGRNSCI